MDVNPEPVTAELERVFSFFELLNLVWVIIS